MTVNNEDAHLKTQNLGGKLVIFILQAIQKPLMVSVKLKNNLYFIVFQRTQHWYTWIFKEEAQRSLCNSSRTTGICFHCLVHE